MRHPTRRAAPVVLLALSLGTLAAAGAAGPGAASAAQQQVPEEMVLALVKNMYQPTGSPEPRILAEEMPAELADRLWLPEGTRIYGSILQEDSAVTVGDVTMPQQGSTTVIAGVEMPVEEVKAALRREMPALGWRTLETFDRIGPQTRQGALIPVVFCDEANDSVWVLADQRGDDDGSSLLRIAVSGDGEGSPCRPRPTQSRPQPPPRDVPRGPERVRMAERLSLMDLALPPRSFMASGRCPGGGGGFGSTSVSTELAGDEIIEHYAAQLEEAGWSRDEPDGPPPSTAAAWTRTVDGQQELAMLQVAQWPRRENCFSLLLSTTDGRGGR